MLRAFCDRECPKFLTPGEDGYTLEQTAVHQQYQRLYESRIEAYLRKHGKSTDEFMQALLEAEALTAHTTQAGSALINSLLLVQDFEAFVQMMMQRALEQE